jgi:carbon monoxide dehydrogenase subunit G
MRPQRWAGEPVLAITFSGEFISPRTPDEVYDFLCDAHKFGPLLPDFESMSVEDATHFTVRVRVAVGPIRGSAELKMELSEAVRPSRAHYQGRGNAAGSQIVISAGFDLLPVAEGTKIAWQGEASITGKLASMAGSMLEPLSKKNMQKLIDGLRWSLDNPLAQAITQPAPEVERPPVELAEPGPQEEPQSAAEQADKNPHPESGVAE